MIESLQQKGCEFESTYVLVFFVCFVFLPLFDSFSFIYYRCSMTSEKYNFDHYIQKVDA